MSNKNEMEVINKPYGHDYRVRVTEMSHLKRRELRNAYEVEDSEYRSPNFTTEINVTTI